MKMKRSRLAIRSIFCMLWGGFFCLFVLAFPPQAEALYGGGMQAEVFPQAISSQKLAGIARQQLACADVGQCSGHYTPAGGEPAL